MPPNLLPIPLSPPLKVPDTIEDRVIRDFLRSVADDYNQFKATVFQNTNRLSALPDPPEGSPDWSRGERSGMGLAVSDLTGRYLNQASPGFKQGLQLANGSDRGKVNVTFQYLGVGPNIIGSGANVTYTADLAVAGAGGLDTGAEAGDTWYYVYVIVGDDTGAVLDSTANNQQPPCWRRGARVNVLLSTSSTAPTVPSGFTRFRRVGAVRNNSSGGGDDTVAFVQDSVANHNFTGDSTGTVTITIGSGDNRVLLLKFSINAANTGGTGTFGVTSVSSDVDGAFTLAKAQGVTTEASPLNRAELWYLVNPTTGAHTVTVTHPSDGGGTKYSVLVLEEWTGVDQTTPFSATAGSQAASGTVTTTITSAAGEFVTDIVSARGHSAATYVVGAGQTQTNNSENDGSVSAYNNVNLASYESGAASVTMSWTNNGNLEWAQAVGSLQPATLAPDTDLYRFTHAADDTRWWWNEDISADDFLILNTSTPATSFTDVSAASVVPATSREIMLMKNDTPEIQVKNKDHGNIVYGNYLGAGGYLHVGCNSSQAVQYAADVGLHLVTISVLGYVDIV